MGLGSRNARRHETRVTAGVDPSVYWDFKPGQDVMTVDGFLGKVTAVHDGPIAGTEVYDVVLGNGLGGGEYVASQLRAARASTASSTATLEGNTAAIDYPELAEVLEQRLDPGRYPDHPRYASLQATAATDPGADYICKGCGAASPDGIGYYANGQQHFPDPAPGCPGPHRGDNVLQNDAFSGPDYSQDDPFPVMHYRPRHESSLQAYAAYFTTDDMRAVVREQERLTGKTAAELIYESMLAQERTFASLGQPNRLAEFIAAGQPGMCENGHLTWGGKCPACRNAEVGDGPMVVNPGDNKPNNQVTAGLGGVPLHSVGDRVVDFRGENTGTVTYVQDSGHPGKSNKVGVEIDGSENPPEGHPDHVHWQQPGEKQVSHNNESVWSPAPDAPPEQHARYHQRKADNQAANDLLSSIEGEHENVVWPHTGARDGQDLGFPPVAHGETPEQMAGREIKGWADDTDHATTGWGMDPNSDSPYNPWNSDWSHGSDDEDDHHEAVRKQAEFTDLCEPDEDGYCHYHRQMQDECQAASGGHGETTVEHQFREENPPNNHDGCTICGDSGHDNSGHVDDMLRMQIDNAFKDVHPYTRAEHARQHGRPSVYSKYQRQVDHGYDLIAHAATDRDFAFHITAAWRDVRSKARRIRSEGGVHITTSQNGYLIAQVRGDHGTYESVIMRAPGTQKVAQWDCGCTWAKYHWGAPDDFSRFSGRMCSHVLALNFEAQARGMFGRTIDEDAGAPTWLKKRDMALTSAREDGQWPDCGPIHVFATSALLMGEDWGDLALLLGTVASVNSPWGEPGPSPVPGIVNGATSPRRQENPASAGFLTAADPDSWNANHLPAGIDSKLSSLDDALFEPEPMQAEATFDPHLAFLPLLIPIAEAIGAGGAGAAAAEGGAAAAGAGEAGAAAGAGEGAAGGAAGGGGAGRGLMSRLPKLPGGGEGGGMGKANEVANQLRNFTDRDKNEGERARQQSIPQFRATLHNEPEAALPSTDGADGDADDLFGNYPADQTWSGYAGDPDPDPMPKQANQDNDRGLMDQARCKHDGAWNAHGQCLQCGYIPPTEGDEECDEPWCKENNFPDGWHTKGEHVDPSHQDIGHEDYQSAQHGVNEAIGNHPDAWMLDHQPQGPTKYSVIDTGTDYLMPGDQQASGGGLEPGTNFKTDPTSLEPEDQSFVSTGSRVQYGGETVDDIVSQFQSSAGAAALGGSGSNDTGASRVAAHQKGNSDIAMAAKAFLAEGEAGLQRTAMAVFSPAEQQALIGEGEHTGATARNLDGLQIEGTHYEALEAALASDDEDTWLD